MATGKGERKTSKTAKLLPEGFSFVARSRMLNNFRSVLVAEANRVWTTIDE